MPNWVFNTIRIKGKSEEIDRFLSDAIKYENGTIKFSSWIPVPETFIKYDTTNYPDGKGLEIGKRAGYREDSPIVTQELIDEYKAATKLQMEQYGVVGWYEYNGKTYGCKWDTCLNIESHSECELTLTCETPWAPPLYFFRTMSKRYPELSFEMNIDSVESGFAAKYLFEKGAETLLESGKYYDGVYIRDDEKVRIWARESWLWLKYKVDDYLWKIRRILMNPWRKKHKIEQDTAAADYDDDLPF